MKVVILAGGLGTRISEETTSKPKPMVEIGGKPILWHIMKTYSYYGFNEFIICLGYKGYMIKEYFHHYYLHQADATINLQDNSIDYLHSKSEPWKITLVDTGLNSLTGTRIKHIRNYTDNETFLLTYGDGVCDIDINDLVSFHKKHGNAATLTAVRPPGRFGTLSLSDENTVNSFQEKPIENGGWINGGFFVLEQKIFDFIDDGKNISWEREPLEKLTQAGELMAYKNPGFWRPMDTLRDKRYLEELIQDKKAPWMVWENK